MICNKCKLDKPDSSFKMRNDIGKLRKQCIVCFRPHKKKAYKKWAAKNKDKIRMYINLSYDRHKEEIQAKHKIYYNTVRGRLVKRALDLKRKRIGGDIDTGVTQQVYEENIRRFGTLTCELCFKPVIFGQDSLEHFHPVSRKGEYDGDINERRNLGVAHGATSKEKCNSKKCAKTYNEWVEYLKVLTCK